MAERWFFPFCLLLLLTGCNDPVPPSELVFPPAFSQFSGDTLTFRGNIDSSSKDLVDVELDDGSGAVAAVLDDRDNSWELNEFALPADNPVSLTLTVTNQRSGNAVDVPITIDRSAVVVRMTAIAASADQLFVADTRLKAIVRIDPGTGRREIISGPDVGTGPDLELPSDMLFSGSDLFVLDIGSHSVVAVDTASGDRTLVTGADRGLGIELDRPRVFTQAGNRLLIADTGLDAIVSVDVATGNRKEVFREFSEGDPVILSPRAVVAGVDGTLFVADDQYDAVIGIDLSAGDFFLVTGINRGQGPLLSSPRDMLSVDAETVVILDSGADSLVAVNLVSGDRSTLTDGSVEFDVPVAFDAFGDGYVIADNGSGRIFAAGSGEVSLISSVKTGEGTALSSPFGAVEAGGRWFVTDRGFDAVVEVSPGDSSRAILVTSGPDLVFVDPGYMAVDENAGKLYFSYAQFDLSGIVEVDLATGVARALASPVLGDGPLMINPADIAWQPGAGQLLVYDAFHQRLLAVDPVTFVRSTVADSVTGTGAVLSGISTFALDDAADRAYLLDSFTGRILDLELGTGNRIILEGPGNQRRLVDIALDRERVRLLLLDQLNGEIVALSFLDGAFTTLSGEGTGQGEMFENPTGIFNIPGDDLLMVVDAGLDALFLVDLTTGDRVIVSK